MHKQFGLVRIATVVPPVGVGAVSRNVQDMLAMADIALEKGADIIVYPELCVTGYTCGDLFQQRTLWDAATGGLRSFLKETKGTSALFVIGLPLRVDAQLFNCAVVCQEGHILGVVPKTYLPNYREFYEKRWFSSGFAVGLREIQLCGGWVPFGKDLLFRADDYSEFTVGIELCEDLWAPVPPSTELALQGATVIVNSSASDDQVGKVHYRRDLVRQQSGRCLSAYVYCSAGVGESTTDVVFGGHCMVAENGTCLNENERFQQVPTCMLTDIDVAYLVHERCQNTVFGDGVADFAREQPHRDVRHVSFNLPETSQDWSLLHRPLRALPFVPGDRRQRHDTCREIFAIQSIGLASRLEHTGIRSMLIGVSGGLDSTLALLVAVEACDRLGISHDHIHAITMPGFGTSERTLSNVEELCSALGVALETINIHDACEGHFSDIGHDGQTHDTTFENVQARERTQILMDKANMLNGLVIGTGDLSELALGWCTYNADHMSMYAVNAGVPKTLVTFLVEYVAERWDDQNVAATLRDILDTPISPELLPPDHNGDIAHRTEDVIGPYELHDFFLYQIVRCGFPPDKTLFLACQAFAESYSDAEVRKWLHVFVERFFSQQFKRSCMPDGPKVGSVALSPRGDWRMPSDAVAEEWLRLVE
ncbi:MAG: NAD(+) synthase [Candidatus Pacebacteria bacterium]|nr:NAD(+) synthase [Candidatus Paceibacterota bacterium]